MKKIRTREQLLEAIKQSEDRDMLLFNYNLADVQSGDIFENEIKEIKKNYQVQVQPFYNEYEKKIQPFIDARNEFKLVISKAFDDGKKPTIDYQSLSKEELIEIIKKEKGDDE